MNMWIFWVFGLLIEWKYGIFWFGMFVFVIVIFLMVSGSIVFSVWEGLFYGVGFLGVFFGFFGFVWMKLIFEFFLGFCIILLMLIVIGVFFLLGLIMLDEELFGYRFGNWVYIVGFLIGLVIGLVFEFFKCFWLFWI